jgi:hypothetical protein
MFVSVALAFLVATSSPASEAAAAAPNAAPVKEKKICRKDEAVTGSITSRRVCKTKAEWEGGATQRAQTPADLQRSLPAIPPARN